ncbi:hypothetical protein L914_12445 [Phytophthora nicotianae]|uniref:Uncharacterized protein n=2 Tax=Phytophthora nicotianae TaxID=4792 RepID=V9EV13_PHYNI|nr:hypothetical protein F443_12912 [Phytophthora nicotianae P1569]ETM41804.1 hypothetical protein L914_12445 [Phytophthora nicotianae]
MDQISKLLDDQSVSLDEVLAFIDSRDFDLSMTEEQHRQVDSIFFDDSIGIEDDLLVLASDQISGDTKETSLSTTHQPEAGINVAPSLHKAGSSDCHSGSLVRAAVPTAPYEERGRVRDRVIRLRALVKQLEQQLEDLNRRKAQVANGMSREDNNAQSYGYKQNIDNVGGTASTAHSHDDVVTWHAIAIRQYAARRGAEMENSSLRQRLEEQLGLAKRLKNLIRG